MSPEDYRSALHRYRDAQTAYARNPTPQTERYLRSAEMAWERAEEAALEAERRAAA